MGQDFGKGFQFCDPLSSSHIVADLVKERESIAPKDISSLLNLEEGIAKKIYELVRDPDRFKEYEEEYLQYIKKENRCLTFWHNVKEKYRRRSTNIMVWFFIWIPCSKLKCNTLN